MCPVCPGSPRCLFTRTVLSEFIGTPLDENTKSQSLNPTTRIQDRMKKRHEITVSPRFNFIKHSATYLESIYGTSGRPPHLVLRFEFERSQV